MPWSTNDRLRLLSKLAGVERLVLKGYRLVLGLLIIAIVVGAAAVVEMKPWGPGHQGEWIYFGAAALLALGWAAIEYVRVRRRQRKSESRLNFRSIITEGGDQQWELRWGADRSPDRDADDGYGLQFSSELPAAAIELSQHELPDKAALQAIEAELDRGVALNDAIQLVEPAFGERTALWQRACRLYVVHRLNQQGQAAAND
jgi:hypothetical protein